MNTERCTMDVTQKWCERGEWQEHNIPCLDAMAYYRLHEKLTVNVVLENHINKVYTYENEKNLLRSNIVPVCMETLTPDGVTNPPLPLTENRSGRPKKERFRSRSIPRDDSDKKRAPIVCSICSNTGHNKRTCTRRDPGRRATVSRRVTFASLPGEMGKQSEQPEHSAEKDNKEVHVTNED